MKLFTDIMRHVGESLAKQALAFCIVIIVFAAYCTRQGFEDALSSYGVKAYTPDSVMHSRSF